MEISLNAAWPAAELQANQSIPSNSHPFTAVRILGKSGLTTLCSIWEVWNAGDNSKGQLVRRRAAGRGARRRGAGHWPQCTSATHANFESLAREHGLEFFPVTGDPRGTFEGEAGREWVRAGSNPLRFMNRIFSTTGPALGLITLEAIFVWEYNAQRNLAWRHESPSTFWKS